MTTAELLHQDAFAATLLVAIAKPADRALVAQALGIDAGAVLESNGALFVELHGKESDHRGALDRLAGLGVRFGARGWLTDYVDDLDGSADMGSCWMDGQGGAVWLG